ncbi:hypothetical protein [Saccharopolyspora taberi]|uniref:Magnesium transporter n=1 Tax=Saccharopolyspora taberi TaxID=60895 RepID=A0ABN3V0G6_9PSEU
MAKTELSNAAKLQLLEWNYASTADAEKAIREMSADELESEITGIVEALDNEQIDALLGEHLGADELAALKH